ncbi:MAG: hypothetical protein ABJE00_16450, partial [Erythrobacter sp.]
MNSLLPALTQTCDILSKIAFRIICSSRDFLSVIVFACCLPFATTALWTGAMSTVVLINLMPKKAMAQQIISSNLSVSQLVEAAVLANPQVERVVVLDGPNGLQIVQFFNIATGLLVSIVESTTPNIGGGGGGGNTGAGINGADAAAQIDGTIYITNPETVGGDVFNPFGVNLAEQLFQNVRDFRNSGFGLSEGDDAAGIPEGGNDQRNGALGRVSGTASNNAENVNVLGSVLGEVTGPTVRPVGQVLDDTSTREEGRAEAV